ncbi:MAG TPA: penicillin-binding transpeptidase domain-containing protein, partial [Polyangiaceae bacterium]
MNFWVPRAEVGEFRRRYRWLVLFVLTTFLIFIGRLMQLQVLEGGLHRAEALRNIVGERRLATTRGVIRDAYGKVLAANRPSYNVHVVPQYIDMEKTWPEVVKLMRLEPDEAKELQQKILDAIAKGEKRAKQQTQLKVDVDRNVVAALETHAAELRGIDVVPVPVRYYPYGSLAAHMLGYMREVDADTLARLQDTDYRAGDRLGAVGVERRWESYLRGQRGWRKFIRGRAVRERVEELEERYLEEPRRQEPIPGRDISLTVDIELERSIERAMRGQLAGAVVVVDVRTGRVLAALSKPSFDPNLVSGGGGKEAVQQAFRRYLNDPLKPTLDKTISAAYPPGSTYKPFSALAGLEQRIINPRSEVDCRGGYEYGKRYFRCTGVHRHVNLHEAMVQSCNTYFY